MVIFKIFGQLTRHPLIELFHLSSLLQMPNNGRMVDVGFLAISSVIVGGSFSMMTQLVVVNFRWLASLLICKALFSSVKLLGQPLHCMLSVPGPNALLMLRIVSAAL